MDVRQYLTKKGYSWREIKRPSGLQAEMNCPFHADTKRKFAINLETGMYKCLLENTCGVEGSWYDFQKGLGDVPKKLDNDVFFNKKKQKKYIKPTVTQKKPGDDIARWLESRGITKEVAERFNIGQIDDEVIIFPYYKDKDLVGVKYRNIKNKKMWKEKSQEPVLYNRDICNGSPFLIITEGEMDAIAMEEYGFNAVSVPSGCSDLTWIEHEWEWLSQFKKIYLIFDYDSAGRKAVEIVATRLGRWRCYDVLLPEKDVNDCLISGTTKEEILSFLNNARETGLDVLKAAGDFMDDVRSLFAHQERLFGKSTGFDGLDRYIKGWREQELTVWTGQNGSGKSTFLNQCILNLIDKRENCCVASLEMPVVKLLRWAILQMSRGGIVTTETIEKSLGKLNEHLWLVNTVNEITIDELVNVFIYAARRYGCKHFVLDSLMRIKLKSSDEYKEQRAICSELVAFGKEYNAHVHLVAHPRKGQSDRDLPDKVDVSGSGNITNLAHNVIAFWRADPEKKAAHNANFDNRAFVKKNREWGVLGSVKFSFDEKTKRFKEVR